MVCVVSLCIDVEMFMNVCFLSYIFFYMLCMWFHGWIEVWEGEWMSFNCFSKWAKRFLQGVQSNCPQGVRWQKGSLRDKFCPHFPRECREAQCCARSVQAREKSQGCKPKWIFERLLLQACAESRGLQHPVEVEGLPQGVRARGLQEGWSPGKKYQEE